MVAMSLFGILMTALYAIFQFGLSAWHKTNTKNELLQEVQVLNFKLQQDLEVSTLASLSADGTQGVVAFLTPLDEDGDFVLDSRGRPEWQAYVIYYLDATENVVYRREVIVPPGSPQRRVATLIEEYNSGAGEQPLNYYSSGGQTVARNIEEFEPVVLPAPVNQLSWRVLAERPRYGSERPETIETVSAALLRN